MPLLVGVTSQVKAAINKNKLCVVFIRYFIVQQISVVHRHEPIFTKIFYSKL